MDVANGSQLWGQEYTRKLSDVLALQDELSREISRGLRLTLTREEEKKLTKRYTEDPEAYQLYLKARHYWHRRTAEGAKKSEEYLRQAIDQDPAYTLAYAALADSYSLASFFHAAPPRATMPRAKAAAAKALEIDDELAEAHISLGYASFTYDWDWPAAVRHFDRALALNRSAVLNHSYYPFYLTVGNRPDEAIDIARRAFAQDPLSASASHTLAVQLALAGKHDETIEESRRTIDLDPNFGLGYHMMAASFAAKGMYREALPLMERGAASSPPNVITDALFGYVRAKRSDSAIRRCKSWKSSRPRRRLNTYLPMPSRWSMRDWATTIGPSRGSRRPTKSACSDSRTCDSSHSGTLSGRTLAFRRC